jgi:hypothetical protein
MKNLSSALIKELNRNHAGGIFFEAINVTRDRFSDPPAIDYFANFDSQISFEGHLYKILPMEFSGAKVSSAMNPMTNEVALFNHAGVVDNYFLNQDIRLRRNPIDLLFLHFDRRTHVISRYEWDRLRMIVVRPSPSSGQATIFCSDDIRLGDRVPKGSIETDKAPMIRADVIRSGV